MKTVSKTLRLSPETISKIEEWPGDSFTQKFANMVDWMCEVRPVAQRELDRMKKERDDLRQQLSDLKSVRYSLVRLEQAVNRTMFNIGEIEKTSKEAMDCVRQIAGCDHD